jgi:hypothetical protein
MEIRKLLAVNTSTEEQNGHIREQTLKKYADGYNSVPIVRQAVEFRKYEALPSIDHYPAHLGL